MLEEALMRQYKHATFLLQAKQRRDQEVAELDDEAAKRRQRVALWQEQRRAAQQAEEAEAQKQEEAAEAWTLDDDIDGEYGQVCHCHAVLLQVF